MKCILESTTKIVVKNVEKTCTVKSALSIECFSPCNSSMHFFAVGKSAWMHVKSEYRVLSFAEDRKHRTRQIPISLLRFVSVKSFLLWLIYQSGG